MAERGLGWTGWREKLEGIFRVRLDPGFFASLRATVVEVEAITFKPTKSRPRLAAFSFFTL
jgi:hypothetical protein